MNHKNIQDSLDKTGAGAFEFVEAIIIGGIHQTWKDRVIFGIFVLFLFLYLQSATAALIKPGIGDDNSSILDY